MENNRTKIVIALMLTMFLAAFEGTVVSTAMPTIARDLNGYKLISWVFSAYLLTSAVSTPIYGKLSDLLGRKKVLITGIIIFLVGTVLSGLSQTMVQLIISRAIQGLGAGSIITLTYTIIGDLYDISGRAKIQGLLSTIWGVASILGPFIGGVILLKLSWHWIFFVNIPFGLLGIFMISKYFHEEVHAHKIKIDYLGTLFLNIAIVALLFASLESSNEKYLIGCLILSIISFIIFIFVERKVEEPIIPFDIFNKTSIYANIIGFIVAVIIIVIQSYLPLYTQNVLGYSPIISGLFLAPISISWFISSFLLAKSLKKFDAKIAIIISSALICIASLMIAFLNISTPIIVLIIAMFIIGFGFGGIMNTTIIISQITVPDARQGVSTSTMNLIRTIGQTLGVSILGSILNRGITMHFNEKGIHNITSNTLGSATNPLHFSLFDIQKGFYSGLHLVFISLLVLAIVGLIISVLSPKIKNHH
ncbi:MDR family MFS transporter [uncultured Clostridium sp.]|jgi:EmrB/QacA subfamily drug resistance transporter|uniref:MDR family MFS transporter n=1 Tax=uncultured Clostridium sp. TaxID=59620 RepID=UPI0026145D4B|nr:MDR family MFS transporter [uncultured Clostridium sp.]